MKEIIVSVYFVLFCFECEMLTAESAASVIKGGEEAIPLCPSDTMGSSDN